MAEFHSFNNDGSFSNPKHFDAIFMDLNMPIMNGYDACKHIADIYSRLIRQSEFQAKPSLLLSNNNITSKPLMIACSAYVDSEVT